MAGISTSRRDVIASPIHSFATGLRHAIGHSLGRRKDDECHPQPGVDLCEKPAISSNSTTWVIVGVIVGSLIFLALSILVVLHFRRRRQDKREDMEERFQPSDYGLDDIPSTTRKKHFAASADDVSTTTSPAGYPRRSRDPLQSATDLKSPPPGYHGNGNGNGYLNPFDDASSFRSGTGSSYPPSRRGEK
ncbi:uncharacterized protein CTHT_0018900 [Thermochaetoides thermophila DSM 1495]|uniref:Epidermal growth factor receptor-like transmembrane-juxtamembrane segment domain-containing protein n=1 Tax=Chaetomium thermophilum (strain DSM 1495 / CBS 144.50 / IMI 039719) TaxID=759272 RepID=G0S2Y1_CHATD|nr:hypothetical protein CTHT_0018900 [Thermochaetoides thermophila DSM 1495]EGS22364.1 hypothetical protein CTHT_0018900 [Thermochaetoides thermophila DSM 1495]